MVSVGDRVRAYNSPTHVYEVVETDVERDVSVDGASSIWRLPSGDTLLQNVDDEDAYLVVAGELMLLVE